MSYCLPDLLRDSDAGARVDDLAKRYDLDLSAVYRILREHRPDRPRTARKRTSNVPAKIAALAAAGSTPNRVAELLSVSRQYVYRWWPHKIR